MIALTKIELAILFDIYGSLLTDKQQQILNYYCNFDYSLAEIAEECNITRQAARDAIVKGQIAMNDCEKKLGIVSGRLHIKQQLNDITALLDSGDIDKAKHVLSLALLEVQ